MTDLDDDIRRIAGMRGRTIDETERLVADAAAAPPISYAALYRCLSMEGVIPAHDLEWFDHLPQALRDLIREEPTPINSMWVYRLWFEVRDESLVVEALRHVIAKRRPKT